MKISTKIPAIYKTLHKKFGATWDDLIIICVGDTVYTKDPSILREDLLVHEKVHEVQQRVEGSAGWWNKYIEDPQFRLSQEIEAYKIQAHWVRENINDRNLRRRYFKSMANDLSSEMYGNLVTFDQAMEIIKKPI